MSVTVTVELNDGDIRVRGSAMNATVNERRQSAIIMAAMDAVGTAMESGKQMEIVSELIEPTIKQRLAEAQIDA